MVTKDDVRNWALSLPEAAEQDHWGKQSFRVRGKIFAVIQPDGPIVTIKMPREERLAFITTEPDTYVVPDRFANLNYLNVRLDRVEPESMRQLLIEAWMRVSPRTLVKAYRRALTPSSEARRDEEPAQ